MGSSVVDNKGRNFVAMARSSTAKNGFSGFVAAGSGATDDGVSGTSGGGSGSDYKCGQKTAVAEECERRWFPLNNKN